MPKGQKTQEQQRTNATCTCGERGQPQFSASLKDGTRQMYCCQECMEDDATRQKEGSEGSQGGQGSQGGPGGRRRDQ